MNFVYALFSKRGIVYLLTAEESWVLFNCKILPDLCFRAGNGENLYKFQVLTSQATCFKLLAFLKRLVLLKSLELIDR